jgi:cytochrome P450
VRINPREVHISDPDFYDEIYAPAARVRWKDPKQVPMIGAPFSMGATWHHGHHRFRRSLIKNHFSRQSIEKIATTIRKKAEILCGRLEEASATGRPLNVSDAFAALTSDIIAGYAFDIDLGFLEDPLFRNDVYRSALELDMLCHVLKFFPFLLKPVRWLPSSVTEVLGLQNKSLGSLQEVIDQRIISSLRTTGQSGHMQEKERESIFTSLCHQDVPPEERTLERLRDESLVLLIAGAEATARALAAFAYYMATGSINVQKLRHELRQVMPTCTSQAPWAELEHLPYLVGLFPLSFPRYGNLRNI